MIQDWIFSEGIKKEDWFGFVYIIRNVDSGKMYIGKKVFWNNNKKPLTKGEIAEQSGPGRKPTHKVVTKESNWKTYWGSNKELLKDLKIEGPEKFQRQILKLCKTKKQLTYYEIHYQCIEEVLIKNSYNDNISGRYFRKDFIEV